MVQVMSPKYSMNCVRNYFDDGIWRTEISLSRKSKLQRPEVRKHPLGGGSLNYSRFTEVEDVGRRLSIVLGGWILGNLRFN